MMLTRNAVIISMAGLLIALTGPVDAARPNKAKQNQAQTINGIVVHHRGKPVGGAYVHAARHHSSHHAKAAGAMAKARPKAAGTRAHHGIMTAANGTFSMRVHHAGMVMLVAHKKNVGTGHARAAAGASVTIRLHKHHHHHS